MKKKLLCLSALALVAGCFSPHPYEHLENWLIREDPVRMFAVPADIFYVQGDLFTKKASVPMMADYAVLDARPEKFFLTHGHLWNEYHLPPLGMGTVLAHGHTHIPELKKLECGISIFNPGSVALPKGGSLRSFGYFDGQSLKHYVI